MTDFDVVDALAGFAEDLQSDVRFAERLHAAVGKMKQERDAAREEAARLTDEIKRLRGALYTVMGACDAECAACGAYYVAKKALDDTKEKP